MAEAGAHRQGLGLGKYTSIVALTMLSACQVVPKGPPRAEPTPPTVGNVPEPVGPTLPTDVARNRVALLVPMTGPNAGVGTAIANAATMAVLDTGGANIRITTYDTATGAAGAAQKALAEGNRLILGPLLADDVRAVAPVARAAKVPVISFSNDAGIAGNGTYVMGYAPAQSVERVVAYAKAKGVRAFAALVPAGLYGQRASTAFIHAVESGGGQVVAMQTYDHNAGSITAAIARLSQASPFEAIMIADSGRTAAQAVPLLRAKGRLPGHVLGTELWNSEAMLATNPALRGAWFASVADGLYTQLAAKYRVRFGKSPYRLASLGYDSVLLVSRIGADWRPGTAFPAARLTDIGGFSGIDGAFRFGRDGVAERALEVQQAGVNGFSVVAAAPNGF